MNKNLIIKLLESKGTADNLEIAQAEKLINLFPYCEITRIMDLIFKKKHNDILFKEKLSEHIMHIHDREFLFFLVNENKLQKESRKKEEKIHHLTQKKSFHEWLRKPNQINSLNKEKKNKVKNDKINTQNTNDLMTETLAKLYIEQKHFNQAIRAYEILSLKYPKKSSFFVREIEKIKQLILKDNE